MSNPEKSERWGYNVAFVLAILGGFVKLFSPEAPVLDDASLVIWGIAAGFAGCEALFGTRP